MQNEKKINQQMMRGLSPQKIQGSYPVHENGKKLQNNMSESIRGFPFWPPYSHQGEGSIGTLPKKKAEQQDTQKIENTYSERKQNYKKCIKSTDIAKEKTNVLLYQPRKQKVIKNAFNQEVIQ